VVSKQKRVRDAEGTIFIIVLLKMEKAYTRTTLQSAQHLHRLAYRKLLERLFVNNLTRNSVCSSSFEMSTLFALPSVYVLNWQTELQYYLYYT